MHIYYDVWQSEKTADCQLDKKNPRKSLSFYNGFYRTVLETAYYTSKFPT